MDALKDHPDFMFGVGIIAMLALFLLISSVSGMEASPATEVKCYNATYLQQVINYTDSAGESAAYLTSLIECNYGCDQSRDVCYRWPYGALPSEYYMMLEVFALAALLITMYRLDTDAGSVRMFDVVLPLFMFIMFMLLALQGNNVIDSQSGDSGELVFLVWLNYGLGVFSLVPFFFSVFKFIRGVLDAGS